MYVLYPRSMGETRCPKQKRQHRYTDYTYVLQTSSKLCTYVMLGIPRKGRSIFFFVDDTNSDAYRPAWLNYP